MFVIILIKQKGLKIEYMILLCMEHIPSTDLLYNQ